MLSQVQPLEDVDDEEKAQNKSSESNLAGHSYGITSDPLTQFAVVFCSIIHDADHPGVANAVLGRRQHMIRGHVAQNLEGLCPDPCYRGTIDEVIDL